MQGLQMWPMTTRKPSSAHFTAQLDSVCYDSVHDVTAQRVSSHRRDVSCCRFLCALQPKDRKAWAQRYRTLIKPGGQLATLMFPVDASRDREQGPPFPVTPELYSELLTPEGGHSHLITLWHRLRLQTSRRTALLCAARSTPHFNPCSLTSELWHCTLKSSLRTHIRCDVDICSAVTELYVCVQNSHRPTSARLSRKRVMRAGRVRSILRYGQEIWKTSKAHI